MFMLKPNDIQIMTWLTVGVFSTWGGVVRYLLDVREKSAPELVRGYGTGCCVRVTGLFGGLLVFETGRSNNILFVVSGSAGLDYLYARVLSEKPPQPTDFRIKISKIILDAQSMKITFT